jgi:hypothetical protein
MRVGTGTNPALFVNTANGNVGIGTTSPAYTLDVSGSLRATGELRFGDVIRNNANSAFISFQGASPSFTGDITFFPGGAESVRFRENGNVGIGTSTPSAQLTVNSTVRFVGITGGTLETDAAGNVTVSSDERLKDIEGAYRTGLEAILGLEPIVYRWNRQSGFDRTTTYAGFSAQNVEAFLPESIGEDARGYKTFSTRPLLAALVNAIKELWLKVQGNTERIEALEKRIAELEAAVEPEAVQSDDTPPSDTTPPENVSTIDDTNADEETSVTPSEETGATEDVLPEDGSEPEVDSSTESPPAL